MKILFAAVPQWYPASPYLAAALLVGQLKGRGYDAESYDFNIEFFNGKAYQMRHIVFFGKFKQNFAKFHILKTFAFSYVLFVPQNTFD